MDRVRFSMIGHEGIALWNPLPEERTLRLVDSIFVGPNGRVLDIGCGRATLLIRLLERTGAGGVGVDCAAAALALARSSAAGRVDPSRLELREETFDAVRFGDAAFDVAFCLGSTHAAGGLGGTLRDLRRLLAPGGTALVAEGQWRQDPDPGYLAAIGGTRDELLTHEGNLAAAKDHGFEVRQALVSDEAAFDAYEDRYAANVERFVATHPDDPEADAFLHRIRAWRAAYVRWGRDTLGFALYVLRRRQ